MFLPSKLQPHIWCSVVSFVLQLWWGFPASACLVLKTHSLWHQSQSLNKYVLDNHYIPFPCMVSLDHDDTSPSAVASLEGCGGMQERESRVFKSVIPYPDRADSFLLLWNRSSAQDRVQSFSCLSFLSLSVDYYNLSLIIFFAPIYIKKDSPVLYIKSIYLIKLYCNIICLTSTLCIILGWWLCPHGKRDFKDGHKQRWHFGITSFDQCKQVLSDHMRPTVYSLLLRHVDESAPVFLFQRGDLRRLSWEPVCHVWWCPSVLGCLGCDGLPSADKVSVLICLFDTLVHVTLFAGLEDVTIKSLTAKWTLQEASAGGGAAHSCGVLRWATQQCQLHPKDQW